MTAPSTPQLPSPEAEKPDPMLGQQLGEYVVRRYIGSGGMGVVYEGEHLTIGRKVAIKFIREDQTKNPNARGLLTEARAASAIRHHGIIDIYGFGEQQGVGQYLVMEYLEGRPLNEILQERAPLSLPEAFALLGEILDALSAAHAVGVIHRDLKPSNIFAVRQSNGAEYIKVLDFGLAKRSTTPEGTTPQTQSNALVGTPQYMAPEQALGEKVGPQTDLYAVGVIAFEMLTGQRPFAGRSHMEIVAHHLRTPAPAPSSIVRVPQEVDTLVLRLLAKEPHQRPPSASAVANELRALLQSQESLSLSTARISRSISVIKPPSGETPAQEATATLEPFPGSPTPKMEAPAPKAEPLAPPSVRSSRWKWGAAAGSLLVLGLGAAAILGGTSINQAPVPTVPASAAASPAPVQPTSVQVASAPTPEPAAPVPTPQPQQTLALAPPPAPTTKREGPGPVPSRKKAHAPTQPVAAAAAPLQAPLAPVEPAPAQAATGTLHVVVKGAWADVWVDGKRLGRVPPMHSYTLAPGVHELELRNPALPPYQRKLVIPPGGTLPHTADFSSLPQDTSP